MEITIEQNKGKVSMVYLLIYVYNDFFEDWRLVIGCDWCGVLTALAAFARQTALSISKQRSSLFSLQHCKLEPQAGRYRGTGRPNLLLKIFQDMYKGQDFVYRWKSQIVKDTKHHQTSEAKHIDTFTFIILCFHSHYLHLCFFENSMKLQFSEKLLFC